MGKTFEERFLDKLEELSQGAVNGVTNSKLKTALKWKGDRYEITKESLLYKKKIIRKPGHGGKVMLADKNNKIGNKIRGFISYSHADSEIKEELVKHLKPLERLGLVESWDDGKIPAGQNIQKEISQKLESADIVILIVSVDFINSAFCNEVELKRAMERNDEGTATVIPVIARNCLWHGEVFGTLKAVPKDGKSIASWPSRDDALTDVAAKIKELAEGPIQQN